MKSKHDIVFVPRQGDYITMTLNFLLKTRYNDLFELMQLWSRTTSHTQTVLAFLRNYIGKDMSIDRIGVFQRTKKGIRYVMGIGKDPQACDETSLKSLRRGTRRITPQRGVGYDLAVRVKDHYFCFDDTKTEREFSSEELAILTRVAQVVYEILITKLEANEHKRQASLDPLTEIPNRRGATSLSNELGKQHRQLIVGIFDIDHFKQVNDTHGHPAGDAAIRAVANIANQLATEAGGFAARIGGEEFLVVIPNDKLKTLRAIRHAVENQPIEIAKDKKIKITISGGYSGWQTRFEVTHSQALGRADEALIYSKEHGRNRITRGN